MIMSESESHGVRRPGDTSMPAALRFECEKWPGCLKEFFDTLINLCPSSYLTNHKTHAFHNLPNLRDACAFS
jgi:hypothetical protein